MTTPTAIAQYRLSRFTPEEAARQLRAEILNAAQWQDGTRTRTLVLALDLVLQASTLPLIPTTKDGA